MAIFVYLLYFVSFEGLFHNLMLFGFGFYVVAYTKGTILEVYLKSIQE
jgi:hypothetical protein